MEFIMNDQEKPISPPLLKLMVVIVNRDQIKEAEEVLRKLFVKLQFLIPAIGTAHSELLDILGLQDLHRGVIFCLLPDFHVLDVMRGLYDKLGINQPGKGIIFTLPLTGVSAPVSNMFGEEALNHLNHLKEIFLPSEREQLLQIKNSVRERWEGRMNMDNSSEIKHDLIIALINQGYSDDLMDKAREAGATGGTVIEVKRLGEEDTMKFFGISVHTEKEAVAIITKREARADIMKAINQFFGLTTEAKGMVFSLPVENLAGI